MLSAEGRVKKVDGAACGAARFCTYLMNGKQKIRALIDTGAACCVIRKDVFEELCSTQKRSRLLQHKRKLYAVNKQVIKTLGDTEVKLDGLPPIPVTIVPDIEQEMILGSEALRMGNGVIDYEAEELKLFDKLYRLAPLAEADIAEVKITSGFPEVDKVVEVFQYLFSTDSEPLGLCKEGVCTIQTGYHPPIRQRPS